MKMIDWLIDKKVKHLVCMFVACVPGGTVWRRVRGWRCPRGASSQWSWQAAVMADAAESPLDLGQCWWHVSESLHQTRAPRHLHNHQPSLTQQGQAKMPYPRGLASCSSPFLTPWLEPLDGLDNLIKSVTLVHYNARSMVTFPVVGHHCPVTGTKLYCLVTEACVCVCEQTA